MVEVWIGYLPEGEQPGREESWGAHRFAALPRPGDTITAWVNGEMEVGVVQGVFHSSRPVEGRGPQGEPGVTIRVVKK